MVMVLLRMVRPFDDPAVPAMLLLAGIAISVFTMDVLVAKAHRRPTTGLDFNRWQPDPLRALVKFLGLVGSVGCVALLYGLLPEYSSDFYRLYFDTAGRVLPFVLVLALPYIYVVDGFMTSPRDGYWQVGMVVLLRLERIQRKVLAQHLLGWLVKGFFLPLMFTYMSNDLAAFLTQDVSPFTSFKAFYDFAYSFLFLIDVAFATVGYLFSLRLTDTHLRSTEPTMLGWVVGLMCYNPFWGLFGPRYLAYDPGHPWGEWLWNTPLLYGLWGTVILLLIAIYAWSTIMFGGRFSNLTHRGIITNGPYRWTKHPAYVAKNLSWWLISLPFLGETSQALQHTVLLLMLNGIYVLRAWTEERHLSQDPAYRAYAEWIRHNGLFRHFHPGFEALRAVRFSRPE